MLLCANNNCIKYYENKIILILIPVSHREDAFERTRLPRSMC